MNKFWKNILFTFLTFLVIFLVTYLSGSFKLVFNSYKVNESIYSEVYYVNSQERYIYFVASEEAYFVNKGKTIICDVTYEDKFITLANTDEEFEYKTFVFDAERIFSLKDNCYFTRLESLNEE